MGTSSVGKTQLANRVSEDKFSDKMGPTVGVEFKNYQTTVAGQMVKATIWDTGAPVPITAQLILVSCAAGQERYRTIVNS